MIDPTHDQADRGLPFRRFRTWAVPLLGIAGAGMLAYLVVTIGPESIARQLKSLKSILPAVLILTGMRYPLQTAGWRLALPREARPPWGQSLSATITGDALGYLTWAGPFTGEPIRALLIRRSAPLAQGLAAGAAERGIYNLTAGLLVWTVLVLLLRSHRLALMVALVATAGGAWAFGAVVRHRIAARHAAFTDAMGALWRHRREALPVIVLLCLAQHGLLVGEAYLMLDALSGDVTLATALVFEAVTKVVNTAGLVVPGRLGVSEGGSALLAGSLGFAASHGLSLALMRRGRALIWAVVGLVLLPFQEARARHRR